MTTTPVLNFLAPNFSLLTFYCLHFLLKLNFDLFVVFPIAHFLEFNFSK